MCGLCRSCHDISAPPDCSDLKDVDIMGRSQMVYSLGCCLLNDVDSILTRECTMHARRAARPILRSDVRAAAASQPDTHRCVAITIPSCFPTIPL